MFEAAAETHTHIHINYTMEKQNPTAYMTSTEQKQSRF